MVVYRKTHRKMVVFHGILWEILSGFITQGWLKYPRTEWRFLARKITDKRSIFQHAMFDYRGLNSRMLVRI